MPSWDHTGTPIGFDGFLHFTSSTTSGSACLMRARTRKRVLLLQSPRSLILETFVDFFAVFLFASVFFFDLPAICSLRDCGDFDAPRYGTQPGSMAACRIHVANCASSIASSSWMWK